MATSFENNLKPKIAYNHIFEMLWKKTVKTCSDIPHKETIRKTRLGQVGGGLGKSKKEQYLEENCSHPL